jgi:hypothetical protein
MICTCIGCRRWRVRILLEWSNFIKKIVKISVFANLNTAANHSKMTWNEYDTYLKHQCLYKYRRFSHNAAQISSGNWRFKIMKPIWEHNFIASEKGYFGQNGCKVKQRHRKCYNYHSLWTNKDSALRTDYDIELGNDTKCCNSLLAFHTKCEVVLSSLTFAASCSVCLIWKKDSRRM